LAISAVNAGDWVSDHGFQSLFGALIAFAKSNCEK